MPRALVISPEPPYPISGGGQMRTASILHGLRRDFEIDLITFQERGAPDPHAAMPGDLVHSMHVIGLPRHSRSTAARAVRNLRRLLQGVPPLVDRFRNASLDALLGNTRYDIGVVEHFWCAPYAEVLKPRCGRLILDLHNIESTLLARSAETQKGLGSLVLRRFSEISAAWETRWLPHFDHVLVCSRADASLLDRAAVVYPNSMPLVPQPDVPKLPVVAFSGNFDYEPNRAAILYFARRVWPELHARHPELRWLLIGKNEQWARAQLGDCPAVGFTGPVDDPIAQIAQATVAVVPLVSGSGTRFKIIEAWAAGTPVVSTSIGAEGLECNNGTHLLVANSPQELLECVSQLWTSAELRAKLSMAGRALYRDRYTWPTVWESLDAILQP